MCLLICLRQTQWGAGPGPVAIDREVVYSDSRFSFSFFVYVFFLAGVMGLRLSTVTCPRQAMVEAVA